MEKLNIVGGSLRYCATFDELTAVQPRGSKMNSGRNFLTGSSLNEFLEITLSILGEAELI